MKDVLIGISLIFGSWLAVWWFVYQLCNRSMRTPHKFCVFAIKCHGLGVTLAFVVMAIPFFVNGELNASNLPDRNRFVAIAQTLAAGAFFSGVIGIYAIGFKRWPFVTGDG